MHRIPFEDGFRIRACLVLLALALAGCANPQYYIDGGHRLPPVRVSDPAAQGDVDLDSPVARGGRVYFVTIVPGKPPRYRIYVSYRGAPPKLLVEYDRKPLHLTTDASGTRLYYALDDNVHRVSDAGNLTRLTAPPELFGVLGMALVSNDLVLLGRTTTGLQLFRGTDDLKAVSGTKDDASSGRLVAATTDSVAYVAVGAQETLRAFSWGGVEFLHHSAFSIGQTAFVDQTLFFASTATANDEAHLWRSSKSPSPVDLQVTSPQHMLVTGTRLQFVGRSGDGLEPWVAQPDSNPGKLTCRRLDGFGPAKSVHGLAAYGSQLLLLASHGDDLSVWLAPTDADESFQHARYVSFASPRSLQPSSGTPSDLSPIVAMLAGSDELWALSNRDSYWWRSDSDGRLESPRILVSDDLLVYVASYRGRPALYLSRIGPDLCESAIVGRTPTLSAMLQAGI